jgi:mono/diheme cytochrome c family protein
MLCAIVAFALCSVAQNLRYRQDPSWKAPPQASERKNPLPASADMTGGGRKLFERNCAQCHGREGEGIANNAADLQLPTVQQQSDGALFWKITNGNPRRGMPSFSGFPEMQRWQLVLYLRTLRK